MASPLYDASLILSCIILDEFPRLFVVGISRPKPPPGLAFDLERNSLCRLFEERKRKKKKKESLPLFFVEDRFVEIWKVKLRG